MLYSFIRSGLPIAAAALRFVKCLLYFFSHFLPLLTAPLETKMTLYCLNNCEAWKTIFSRMLIFKFPPSSVITDEPTLMTTMGLSFFIQATKIVACFVNENRKNYPVQLYPKMTYTVSCRGETAKSFVILQRLAWDDRNLF